MALANQNLQQGAVLGDVSEGINTRSTTVQANPTILVNSQPYQRPRRINEVWYTKENPEPQTPKTTLSSIQDVTAPQDAQPGLDPDQATDTTLDLDQQLATLKEDI